MQKTSQIVPLAAPARSRFAAQAAMLAAVAVLTAACSSTKPEQSTTATTTTTTTSPQPPIVDPVRADGDAERIARIVRILADSSIYFDYDSYTIKPEYQGVLQKDFDALKFVPSLNVRLEGNTDERGSSEYNLALGQKRAESVRRALGILGMPDANMEAVSFGKEKTRGDCHDEGCWSKDRRVDLTVKR